MNLMLDNNMKLLLAVSSLIWTEAVSRESWSILSRRLFVRDRKFWEKLLRASNSASSFDRFQEMELVISDDSDAEKSSPIVEPGRREKIK